MKYIKGFNESKTKNNLKDEICESLIEAYKPVFESYPELNAIPVYAWGRYYRYELAGDPFELFPAENGFDTFYQIISREKIQWDLLSKICEEHNKPGGNLWVGKWGGYSPIREEAAIAFNFDHRGGKCLIIFKEGEEFYVKDIDCQDPA